MRRKEEWNSNKLEEKGKGMKQNMRKEDEQKDGIETYWERREGG